MLVETVPKTLAEIEALPKEMLLATDVAGYLEVDPGVLRWQAQHEPEKLGFPVIVAKSRIKIPKAGFVEYCRRGRPATFDYDIMTERLAIKLSTRLEEMQVHAT